MGRYFILRDGDVVEEDDYDAWARWYEEHYEKARDIDRTETAHGTVLTRFLAMSLSLNRSAPPQLFETSVSGGWLDGQGDRFATLEEARAGHQAWVEKVRAVEEENDLPPPGAGW
jgi:hypothetical protein